MILSALLCQTKGFGSSLERRPREATHWSNSPIPQDPQRLDGLLECSASRPAAQDHRHEGRRGDHPDAARQIGDAICPPFAPSPHRTRPIRRGSRAAARPGERAQSIVQMGSDPVSWTRAGNDLEGRPIERLYQQDALRRELPAATGVTETSSSGPEHPRVRWRLARRTRPLSLAQPPRLANSWPHH